MSRSYNLNWVNVEKVFLRSMGNSFNWSRWICKHLMMCYAHHLAPIGDHIRKKLRTISLMSFVIYWLWINISCLMKRILVVNKNITCLRKRESKSTRIEDTPMVLALDRNASTRKLNWRPESCWTLGRIERRKLATTMGRLDMLCDHLSDQPATSPSTLELPNRC